MSYPIHDTIMSKTAHKDRVCIAISLKILGEIGERLGLSSHTAFVEYLLSTALNGISMGITPREIKNKLVKTEGVREKKEFQDLQSLLLIGEKPTSEQENALNTTKETNRMFSLVLRLILRLVVLKMVRTFLFRKILWPLTNENGFFQRFLEIIREFRIPSPSAFHEFVFYWVIEEGFREIVGCVGVPSVKAIGD